MHNFPSRLKGLREKTGLTQSELAKKLNITRSSVNAWEMGLSAPSTPFIAELSRLFSVTTDFLLGLDDSIVIRTDGLSEKEVAVLMNTVKCFRDIRNEY
jgi:transcriptional regulator with XRE-family HTH domain